MNAAAECVENGQDLPDLRSALAAFQVNDEAESDARRGGQVILAESLGVAFVPDDPAQFCSSHDNFPDREYYSA